ncbi:hypothetical protein [Paenibacillus rhizoplanae]|uniref:hypothetical protein n=1 Tax=Paenibacillus rhizoplanae TaxID=1917181 RepID=UPI003610FDD3
MNYPIWGGLLSDKRSLLELKVFGAVGYIQSKWKQKSEKVLKERLMTTIKSHRYFAASSFLLLMWIGLVIFELIHGVMERRVSVGLFVSLIGASGSILGIADDLSLLFSRLSHRCMEIMHYESSCSFQSDTIPLYPNILRRSTLQLIHSLNLEMSVLPIRGLQNRC